MRFGNHRVLGACGSLLLAQIQTPNAGRWTAQQGTFLQSGTGATPRSIESKLREKLSVKDFGADPTGVADSAAAFAAAGLAAKPGQTIYVPAGTYKVTDETVLTTGITWRGDGNCDQYFGNQTAYPFTCTFIWQATAGKAIFTLGNAVRNVKVENMALSALQTPLANSTYPVAGKYGIKGAGNGNGYGAEGFTFKDLTFFNFERGISAQGLDGGDGNVDWQFDNVKVDHNWFYNNQYGIYLSTTNADAWKIDTSVFANPWTSDGAAVIQTAGIWLDRSGYIQIVNSFGIPAPDARPDPQTQNSDFIRVHGFADHVEIENSQAEVITNFVHVDTTTGYENLYNPITCIHCIVEAPVKIERQYRWNSFGSRYTHSVTATSAASVHIESVSDTFAADYASWDTNKEGFAPITPTTGNVTGNGSFVTVTYVGHGLVTGDYIMALTATPAGYNAGGVTNGVRAIVTDSSHFKYTATGTGALSVAPQIFRVAAYKVDSTKNPVLHQSPPRMQYPYFVPVTSFGANVASDSNLAHEVAQSLQNDNNSSFNGAGGTVRLVGRVQSTSGTVAALATLLTLDSTFRPNREIAVPVVGTAGGGVVGTLFIQSSGVVTFTQAIVSGGNELVLDGVTFTRNEGL